MSPHLTHFDLLTIDSSAKMMYRFSARGVTIKCVKMLVKKGALTRIEENDCLEAAVLCSIHVQTGHFLYLGVETSDLLHEG